MIATSHISVVEAIGRLSLALTLGVLIGLERQWHLKLAGLNTNALVALGACGFVEFGSMVGDGDPMRIAAQVVSGIGFLGAGVILREGISVHGVSTAATLWCAAMVGAFAGAGLWAPSLVAACFVFLGNLLLRPLVQLVRNRATASVNAETHYLISLTGDSAQMAQLRSLVLQTMSQAGFALVRIDSSVNQDTSKGVVTAQVSALQRKDMELEAIVGTLGGDARITAAAWQLILTIPEF
jgi:putative Mg2+ transporter-C (MgtC) family protein